MNNIIQDRARARGFRCSPTVFLALTVLLVAGARCVLADAPAPPPYTIQPGDVLTVSVWNEKDLTMEVLVRPDGALSFPLVGEIQALGHSVEDVRQTIAKRLKPYVADPTVSLAVKQVNGNLIYVIGKVNKPGQFTFSQALDVMQALSLAQGMTPYAAVNDIHILHRDSSGLRSIPFRYGDVEKGHHLEQDIMLHSGDTVVVP
jgi:polysaccharide export outer membrane protein